MKNKNEFGIIYKATNKVANGLYTNYRRYRREHSVGDQC